MSTSFFSDVLENFHQKHHLEKHADNQNLKKHHRVFSPICFVVGEANSQTLRCELLKPLVTYDLVAETNPMTCKFLQNFRL